MSNRNYTNVNKHKLSINRLSIRLNNDITRSTDNRSLNLSKRMLGKLARELASHNIEQNINLSEIDLKVTVDQGVSEHQIIQAVVESLVEKVLKE